MKKSRLFWLTLIGWLCGVSAFAYDFESNGFYYTITSVEKLEVKVDFGEKNYAGDIVIPATVNYKNRELKVTTIGYEAFNFCEDLTSIDFGNVEVLENGQYLRGAFIGCSKLTSVNMKNVKEIGHFAFKGCSALKNVDLQNVKKIGNNAFMDCTQLTSFDFKQVEEIGSEAFLNCSELTTIDFNQLKAIGERAFVGCDKLNSVDLKNVETIGENAFNACKGLTSVTLRNVKEMNSYAFSSCKSLNSVDLGNLKNIGYGAFTGCIALTSIDLKNVKTLDNAAFSNSGLTSIDLKNVEDIGSNAFSHCWNLATIEFGKTKNIGYRAFQFCDSLTFVDFGNVQHIGDRAFDRCGNLKSIDLRNVQTIGYQSFWYCTGLTSIDFKNVQSMLNETFEGCKGLTTIDLKNVKDIGSYDFRECENIELVKTSQTTPPNIGLRVFEETVYFGTLEVPAGSKKAYQTHKDWNRFISIKEVGNEETNCLVNIKCSEGGSICFDDFTVKGGQRNIEYKKGDIVAFSFKADAGYRLSSAIVNGKNITNSLVDDMYTMKIMGQTDLVAVYEKLPLTLTIQHADNGKLCLMAEEGKTYTFAIIAAKDWKINTVTFDGHDVTKKLDEHQQYTTPKINRSAVLNVSFELESNTAIQDISTSNITIKGHDGQLFITGAERGENVSVYTIDGALVTAGTAQGMDMSLELERNQTYVVKVGKRTFKIRL